MTSFRMRPHKALITSITLFRAGGDDDGQITGAAIKLRAEAVPADTVKQLVGANALPGYEDSANPVRHNLLESFWDQDGELRFWNLGPVPVETEIEGDHDVTIGGYTYADAKIKGFSFQLRDQRAVDLSFQVNVYPDDKQVADLSHRLKDTSTVAVAPGAGFQEQADIERGLQGADPLDGVQVTKLKAAEAVDRIQGSHRLDLVDWAGQSDNRTTVRKAAQERGRALREAERVSNDEDPGGEETPAGEEQGDLGGLE